MSHCVRCGESEALEQWRGRWYCHLCKVDEAKNKQVVVAPGIILTVREVEK